MKKPYPKIYSRSEQCHSLFYRTVAKNKFGWKMANISGIQVANHKNEQVSITAAEYHNQEHDETVYNEASQ